MALGGALGSVLVAGNAAALCVAGVALGHIHLRFAWQARHLWHWAGSGGALGPVLVAGDAAALCVAGVALGDIYLRLAWQVLGGALGSVLVASDTTALCVAGVWPGRRGTWSHPPSFCVADAALMALGGALGSVLVAGDASALCVVGMPLGHPPSFGVAGVVLGHIHLRFAWQAWHFWYWVARLGRFKSPVTPRHFAWQAWHLSTSTFVLRGRCGTYGTGWRAWVSFFRR